MTTARKPIFGALLLTMSLVMACGAGQKSKADPGDLEEEGTDFDGAGSGSESDLGSMNNPIQLQSGQPVSGLSGSATEQIYFVLENVPSGASIAVQTMGDGDADLYVNNVIPTSTMFIKRSRTLGTSKEMVELTSGAEGQWFVMVRAYETFSSVSLLAIVTPAGGGGKTECTGGTDECSEGEVRCYYGAKDVCERGPDGCLVWNHAMQCADWTENMDCSAHTACSDSSDCARYTEPYSQNRFCCSGLRACTANNCFSPALAGYCMVDEGHKAGFNAACYSNFRDSAGRCADQ